MNNATRVTDYLWHLVICCNRLAKLHNEVSHQEFLDDYRVHELALRILEILGETTKRIEIIDPEYFETHGIGIVRNLIGLRNRIAHQYDGVDLELIWEVVESDAPALRKVVVSLLLQLRPDADLDALHF